MKILFLTDNFPPESNAPATRTYEHAVRWVRAGHAVTVITTAPNFPEGRLFPGYRNRFHATGELDGIKVVRVLTYITANEGFLKRTLDYMSFMVAGFLAGLFQPRPDVIIGTSPQFFTVCAAWVLSVFRRRPFVFELRDLWPASIKAVGAMQDSRALRALEWIEALLYRKASAIVSVTRSFREELGARGVDTGKIAVVLNGVDLAMYSPRPRDAELARTYDLQDRFVVGYIGTHGMAHALHRVLEAAEILRGHPDVVFLLVGSGAQRDALVEQAAAMGLDNVRFVPRQDKAMMPRIWSLCDVSLIQLKDDPLFRSVIPSKIFESMGMGLPILFSVPAGEASRLVEASGAGVVIPPEQPGRLVEAVLALKADPDRLAAMGQASAAAAPGFSRDQQATRMLEVLAAVAAGERLPAPLLEADAGRGA